jgi:hypothetical protein
VSRFVEPRRRGAEGEEPGAGDTGDGYAARVAKYVPSEIVAAYVAILAVLDPAAAGAAGAGAAKVHTLCLVAFVALLVATPLYLAVLGRRSARKGRGGVPAVQLVVSSLAFVVWAYALRGLTCAFPAVPFDGQVAFVALVLFTVASGLVTPPVAAA